MKSGGRRFGHGNPLSKLWFDLRGYEFQRAIDALRKSAKTGTDALRHEAEVLKLRLEDYRRVGEFEGERDEAGYVLWEQDQVLSMDIDLANEALMELKRAFAIAAYHLWERSVQQWSGYEAETAAIPKKNLRSYNVLLEAAKNLGYPVDPGLQIVVTLANTIKHNNQRHGEKLLAQWPEVFQPGFQNPSQMSDWASAVHLSDEHLMKVFDIVSNSGPVAMPD